jgi:hypothetical protein
MVGETLINNPAALGIEIDPASPYGLTEQDLGVIQDVDRALEDGLKLKRWWEKIDETNSYKGQFQLVRTHNKADRGVGFMDVAPLNGQAFPVMGVIQEMPFDRPKQAPPEAVRDEFRQFVLHYFLRVASFQLPDFYVEEGAIKRRDVRRLLEPFSLCPDRTDAKGGFGYSQLYYKLKGSGYVGKFLSKDEFRIIDLRQIGDKYDWIVLKTHVFDFNIAFSPFGPDVFTVNIPLNEETYLAISKDFVKNRDNPSPDLLGQYGVGYALLKPAPHKSIFAYGPGYFSAGFQLIDFDVTKEGQTYSRMVFVANRPQQVLSIDLDAVKLGFGLADLMSLGLASRVLRPVRNILERFSPRINGVDPVGAYMWVANLLTANLASEQMCTSLETLEVNPMLLTHYMEHYRLIAGGLMTWRHVQDWLNRDDIPERVVTGIGS